MLNRYALTIVFADETAEDHEVYAHSASEAVDALMHHYKMDDGSFATIMGIVNTLEHSRRYIKETDNA
jgi:hypothetical protein